MAKFQLTPAAPFAEYNELNIQGLYLYHRYSSHPKANQAQVIEKKVRDDTFYLTINNWEVYDGPGENAKLVARAQGLHAYGGNWHNSFSLVFEDERFSESTLQVMGIVVMKSGDWPIVGGSGQFTMANGIISKRIHKETSNETVLELTIRAFCPVLNGTRIPYPVTKIGLFGGSGGSPVDITQASKRLESITVYAGWAVDSIAFSYVDYTGQKRSAGRWGGPGGDGPHTIQLGESEVVTEVSGTIGTFKDDTVITSIKLVTNLNKTYGPWGLGNGKDNPFTVPLQPGSGIVGFFARAGDCINAIGVLVRPL